MGLGALHRTPSLQIVLVIQEVEIELFAELGTLTEPLVTEVGDVIEQPAIKAAYQAYLDRVSPSLLGAVSGAAKVEGELGEALEVNVGMSDLLIE